MDIFYFHAGRTFRGFAVKGPGDVRTAFEEEGRSAKELEGFVLVVVSTQSIEDAVEYDEVRRKRNQEGFEAAIVHIDGLVLQFQDAAEGRGIADSAEDIVFLKHLTVRGDAHMDRADIGQGADTFQDIGRMAQDVLDVLGCGPGNAGEGAEGGSVAEIAVRTEKPDVQRAGLPGDNRVACHERHGGNAETAGEVVGAATGDITQERLMPAELQAGDDLVQCAVASTGDDKVRLAGVGAGKVRGITALLRDIDGAEKVRLAEGGNHFRQETPGLTGAGIGVDNKVETF